MKFAEVNSPITNDEIVEYEKSRGVKLHQDFTQFLLETNGGQVQQGQIIWYVDHKSRTRKLYPLTVYGIDSNNFFFYGLRTQMERLDNRYDLPLHLVEIMICDDGHHRLVLSTGKDDYGQIYIWDNQAPFSYNEAILIARSFGDLLSKVEINDLQEGIDRLKALLKERRQGNKKGRDMEIETLRVMSH